MHLQDVKVKEIARYFDVFGGVGAGKLAAMLWVANSIFHVQSACLQKCAMGNSFLCSDGGSFNRRYQRLLSFFKTGVGQTLAAGISLMILTAVQSCAALSDAPLQVVMDRTNWDRGRVKYNFLSVGILVFGVYIPLVCSDLNKKGNSGKAERLSLIDRFLTLWSHTAQPLPPVYITADREFVGSAWLTELEERKLKFVVRIKSCLQFYPWLNGRMRDKKTGVKSLRRYLRRRGQRRFMEVVLDSGMVVYLIIVENENEQEKAKDPFVYLLSNIDGDPLEAARIYRKRYRIEPFFRHMKSNGFNLEQLNLQESHKTSLMFAILSLVYTMAVVGGWQKMEIQPLKVKKYKNGEFQERSAFLYGLTQIKEQIEKIRDFFKYLKSILNHSKLRSYDVDNLIIQ